MVILTAGKCAHLLRHISSPAKACLLVMPLVPGEAQRHYARALQQCKNQACVHCLLSNNAKSQVYCGAAASSYLNALNARNCVTKIFETLLQLLASPSFERFVLFTTRLLPRSDVAARAEATSKSKAADTATTSVNAHVLLRQSHSGSALLRSIWLHRRQTEVMHKHDYTLIQTHLRTPTNTRLLMCIYSQRQARIATVGANTVKMFSKI